MEKLSGHILSIVAAAMIVGILAGFLDQKSGASALIRLMGGLFLAFTVISAGTKLDFTGISDFFQQFEMDGLAASASGENLAREEMDAIIKSEVESYILDKARDLQGELTVEVTLRDSIPVGARLQGNISPYGRARLEDMMEEDLGIAKEAQQWIG